MTAISRAETLGHGDCATNATGDQTLTYEQNGRTYGYSVSALQVRVLPGREHCDSHDLAINVACAHAIWLGQGYEAWTKFKNGEYKEFLR